MTASPCRAAWKSSGAGLAAATALLFAATARAEAPPGLVRAWSTGYALGGAALVGDDRIVVHVKGEHHLRLYTTQGALLWERVTTGNGNGQLAGSGAVASDGTYVYVCDRVRRSVEVFDLDGGFVRRIAPTQDGKPVFITPVAVGVGPDGSVFVLDHNLGRVFKMDDAGNVVSSFGSDMNAPLSMAVDAGGTVYVGDGRPMVWIFDGSTGVSTGAWVLPDVVEDGNRYSEILGVSAVTVRDDAAYVAVNLQWEGRILKLDRDGAVLSDFGRTNFPALSLDDEGLLYALTPSQGMQVWDNKPYVPPPHDASTDAALWLHLVRADVGNSCASLPANPRQAVTHVPANGVAYQLYLVGSPDTQAGSGLTGMQIGIDYEVKPGGLEVMDWHPCSDLQFVPDNWPGAGSGNTITWAKEHCQRKNAVIAGYFDVETRGPATMWLTGYPVTGLAKVANCSGSEGIIELTVPPHKLGWVSFGGGVRFGSSEGCNPLLAPCATTVATEPTTWGKLKSTFGGGN